MDSFARNLDWNLLHTFVVVVQHESMTKAAEELLRSQPAISLAIKRLEVSTGKKLLMRRHKRLTVTPAGQALFEQASEIYSAISRLPVAFGKALRSLSGKVTLAAIDHVESKKLDAHLTHFFARHPNVELEVLVATTANVIRLVELGSAALGICDGVIPKGLHSTELLDEKFGLYCGLNHHLTIQTDLSPEDLRGEPFIGFTADILGGSHMGNVTAFRARESIGQYVRGQSSYVHEVKRMIACGMGIGFLPTHLGDSYVQSGELFRLPPYENEPCAQIHLISNPSLKLSNAETAFLRDLRDAPHQCE